MYGEPGSGKTKLLGTANRHPELGPLLFINAEGGTLSLHPGPPAIFNLVDPDDPEPTPEKALLNFESAYWFLRKQEHPYKSVAIDTFGELFRVYMDYRSRSDIEKHPNSKRESVYETFLADYNFAKNYLMLWLRRFRDLPLHFFVASHSEIKTRADGTDIIRPLVIEKLSKPLEALFDVVGYLDVVEAQRPGAAKPEPARRLTVDYSTTGNLRIQAKWRVPANVPSPPGGFIMNPTLPMIWKGITAAAPTQPNPTQPKPKENESVEEAA